MLKPDSQENPVKNLCRTKRVRKKKGDLWQQGRWAGLSLASSRHM